MFIDAVCVSEVAEDCPLQTSVSTDRQAWRVAVYPNPCIEVLYFEPSRRHGSKLSYELIGPMGSVVRRGAVSHVGELPSIGTASWPDGVFVLVLFSGEELIGKTIVEHHTP